MSTHASPCISMCSEAQATGEAPGKTGTRSVPLCIRKTLYNGHAPDLNTVGLCPCGFESRLRHMGDLQGNPGLDPCR